METTERYVCQHQITDQVRNLIPIELRQVRRSPEKRLFNSLIQQFHYLGYSQPVGEHLKYLAFAGDRLLACIAFSSAPYAITCRDSFIGWSPQARERNRNLLALSARTISDDWQRLYHHSILWLETFVDTERFAGTCYRAANWTWLGLTTGHGKYNLSHEKVTSIKAMYGYPLTRDFQKRLRHGLFSVPHKGYRQEAERIYDAGREVVIETLLAMDARIRELEKLEQRVLELERIIAALTRNSSNSSRPPSSDLPVAKKTKHTRPGNRKQGCQLGHKGKKRELLPSEEMDRIHDIFPQRCESCHLTFSSAVLIPSSQPAHHQVFELPVVVPIKEEYRCHSLLCQCGHRTAASLPRSCSPSLASTSPPEPSATLPSAYPRPAPRWSMASNTIPPMP